MGRDFVIPGVDPAEPDPYRFHTGRKRDHGGDDAIEIIDLVKQFGRARILNGLNLGLPEDQVSMVLGPSGTGKSVLIKHIVGLLYPDSGDVLVHGESIPNMTDDELFDVRKKFGLLFQDGALFGSMNIYDNTAFPLRQHTDKSEEEIGEIVNRRLKEVGLIEAIYKMPNELSGGMRKRAGFARALVLEPAIVMFDEPDSGLDPVRTALLCELIREVHAENGGCYLVISHDLNTARRISDFIAVLWNGKIVESGPKEELFDSENQFVAPVPQRGRNRPALDGLSVGGRVLSRRCPRCWCRGARSSDAEDAARGTAVPPARGELNGSDSGWSVRRRAILRSACPRGWGCGAATQLPTDAGYRHAGRYATPASYRATQEVAGDFGEEPVVVLAEGDLQRLVLTSNLGRLLRLEGCLSGKVPKGAKPIPGPCAELAELDPVQFVAGPATFLNEAVIQIERQLSRLAATVPPDQLRELLLEVAARYGITSAPSLCNPDFLAAVVFDLHQARGTPKARLSYLFPNSHSAQIVLRLRPDLSESERHRALELIKAVVHDPVARNACKFKGKPEPCFELHGGSYVDLRRAGRRRRGDAGAEGRAAGPARRRDRRHGADPAARLPLALAAAAAGDRPGRGGAHLRPLRPRSAAR